MKVVRIAASVAALALTASVAQAQPFEPTGTWGPRPSTNVCFGSPSCSIPTDPIMYNNSVSGLLLAMGASPRCGSASCVPSVSAAGFGRYLATPGIDPNPTAGGDTGPYASWNFNFHISGANAGQYTYRLYYDYNPAVGNADLNFLTLNYTTNPDHDENSWNLGMDFLELNAGLPNNSFNPTVAGEYNFALVAYSGDDIVASTAIFVNTVPEPSTYVLMAAGLAGLALATRRRRMA